MADHDELNSISEGFADSLNSFHPDLNLCNQDGYEIIVSVFGKAATCERLRNLADSDMDRLVKATATLLETNAVTAQEVISSLKAGLEQWSDDADLDDF